MLRLVALLLRLHSGADVVGVQQQAGDRRLPQPVGRHALPRAPFAPPAPEPSRERHGVLRLLHQLLQQVLHSQDVVGVDQVERARSLQLGLFVAEVGADGRACIADGAVRGQHDLEVGAVLYQRSEPSFGLDQGLLCPDERALVVHVTQCSGHGGPEALEVLR